MTCIQKIFATAIELLVELLFYGRIQLEQNL